MNGIVSQNMKNLGANYKINFGLTLPLLKKIAEEIPADAQLANALWNDTAVRESMMLAPMLYPSDEFNEDEAEKWVTNMPNIEIADICCKSLFRRQESGFYDGLKYLKSLLLPAFETARH